MVIAVRVQGCNEMSSTTMMREELLNREDVAQ